MSKKLDDLRLEINKIDKDIIQLLEKRFKVVDEVAKVKKEMDIPVLNTNREKEILDKINSDDIKEIYKTIFVISKARQNGIIKN